MKTKNNRIIRLLLSVIYLMLAVFVFFSNLSIYNNVMLYLASLTMMLLYSYRKLGSIKRLISSIEVIYLIAYSLYALMPSLQFLLDNGKQRLEFFPITYEGIYISFKWYLLSFLILSFLMIILNYPKSRKYEQIITNSLERMKKKKISIIFDIIAVACIALFAYSYLKNGFSFIQLSFSYRRKLSDFSIRQYVWVYMMVYSIIVMCECAFNKDFLKNKRRVFQFFYICLFWAMSLLVDRRHIIPVFIAVILYFILTNKKISLKIYIILISFIVLMVSYALIRGRIEMGKVDFQTMIYEGFAEFILTGYITAYYATNPVSNFYLGSSYIWDTVTRVFPKSIFPWKPEDFAVTFMNSVLNNRVGFAFNPIAEGYLNFGNFLVIFVPFIILGFIEIGYSLTKKEPLFYFVICSYALDFCRGQFANCIFDIVLMYLVMRSMKRVRF